MILFLLILLLLALAVVFVLLAQHRATRGPDQLQIGQSWESNGVVYHVVRVRDDGQIGLILGDPLTVHTVALTPTQWEVLRRAREIKFKGYWDDIFGA